MAAESAADRLAFLDPNDFGSQATYTIVGGSASLPFSGVFNNPHLSVHVENADVADRHPTFICREQDIPAGAKGGDAGDALAVTGAGVFTVAELRPDGAGMVTILLGAAY
jgi:hypothetical protein